MYSMQQTWTPHSVGHLSAQSISKSIWTFSLLSSFSRLCSSLSVLPPLSTFKPNEHKASWLVSVTLTQNTQNKTEDWNLNVSQFPLVIFINNHFLNVQHYMCWLTTGSECRLIELVLWGAQTKHSWRRRRSSTDWSNSSTVRVLYLCVWMVTSPTEWI